MAALFYGMQHAYLAPTPAIDPLQFQLARDFHRSAGSVSSAPRMEITQMTVDLKAPHSAAEIIARSVLDTCNSYERACFLRAFERAWNDGDPDVEVRLIEYGE